MKIISQILLLSLIFVISCDKDSVSSEEVSFSIVGTWKNERYTNDGGSSWDNIGSTNVYNFRSNGTYTTYNTDITDSDVTSYYKLCESSNVIHLGFTDQSFTGDCNCESDTNNDYISDRFEREGLNTIFFFSCYDGDYGLELVRQ
jgi:hypothetical protein